MRFVPSSRSQRRRKRFRETFSGVQDHHLVGLDWVVPIELDRHTLLLLSTRS